MEVYVDDEAKLTLHGLQQHYVKLKENEKNKKLFELLDVLEFNQVCEYFLYVHFYLYIIHVSHNDILNSRSSYSWSLYNDVWL